MLTSLKRDQMIGASKLRKADTRLAAQDDAKSTSTDEGGMQQKRHPGLGEEIVKTAEPEQGRIAEPLG